MPAVLPALVIGTMLGTATACVDTLESERVVSSSTGPDRGDASSSSAARVMRFTPAAPKPADALAFDVRLDAGRHVASEEQGDGGADLDAGADGQSSEFERAIVYDCTETLRCSDLPANNIPACVVSVREALNAASPQAREAFMRGVRRCRPQRACEYVDCATSKAR